jgi:hypothetical protein
MHVSIAPLHGSFVQVDQMKTVKIISDCCPKWPHEAWAVVAEVAKDAEVEVVVEVAEARQEDMAEALFLQQEAHRRMLQLMHHLLFLFVSFIFVHIISGAARTIFLFLLFLSERVLIHVSSDLLYSASI